MAQQAEQQQEVESQVDLSAISYSADAAGDTQEESVLFRQLESSTTTSAAVLDYSEDEVIADAYDAEAPSGPEGDEGDEVIVKIEDGLSLGVVVAPVEAPLGTRSAGCNGLRVLTCKATSSEFPGFRAKDIIVEVNDLSLKKMTCENALAVIKKATGRKVKVLRKDIVAKSHAGNNTEQSKENIENENENDKEEDIHSQWKRLKRRVASRIEAKKSEPSIFMAGNEVKVDRDRRCVPTMEPYRDYVPGGRRCENKEVFTTTLADLNRRSKKRSLSSD